MSDALFAKRNDFLNSELNNRTSGTIHLAKSQKVISAKTRIHVERSKRLALLGLGFGIICGFFLCLWSKPLIPCTIGECCLKKQLRAEIQHELDSKQQTILREKVQSKKVLLLLFRVFSIQQLFSSQFQIRN